MALIGKSFRSVNRFRAWIFEGMIWIGSKAMRLLQLKVRIYWNTFQDLAHASMSFQKIGLRFGIRLPLVLLSGIYFWSVYLGRAVRIDWPLVLQFSELPLGYA